MSQSLIGLGSNLGDKEDSLRRAIGLLKNTDGIEVERVSRFIQTQPIGGPASQPPFLNAAAVLQISLTPRELFARLSEIENQLGRTRDVRWDNRIIDLDILLFDDRVETVEQLAIPHPRLAVRRFVLEPAVEICPDWMHPELKWSIRQLWDHLIQAAPRFSLCAFRVCGRTDLASRIAERSGAKFLSGEDIPQPADANGMDWTQLAVGKQLQYAHRRRELLESPGWSNCREPVVSDFCDIESLVLAEMTLVPDELESFRRELSFAKQDATPKLHIIWNQFESENDFQKTLHENLKRRLIQSKVCPVYTIDSEDESWMVRECVAAIDSMQ